MHEEEEEEEEEEEKGEGFACMECVKNFKFLNNGEKVGPSPSLWSILNYSFYVENNKCPFIARLLICSMYINFRSDLNNNPL